MHACFQSNYLVVIKNAFHFFHQVCLQHHHSAFFSMHFFLPPNTLKKLVWQPNTPTAFHIHMHVCIFVVTSVCVCVCVGVCIEARVFAASEKCMNYGCVYSHIIVNFRLTRTGTRADMPNNDAYAFISSTYVHISGLIQLFVCALCVWLLNHKLRLHWLISCKLLV